MLDIIYATLLVLTAAAMVWFIGDSDIVGIKIIILIILVLGTIFLNIYINKLKTTPTEWETVWSTDIVALKDNTDIEGAFRSSFIASGTISEVTYYYCMESTIVGNHMIKIPSKDSYIKESNTEQPSIKKQTIRYVDEKVNDLLSTLTAERYIITVPNGSIDNTYNIDMQ